MSPRVAAASAGRGELYGVHFAGVGSGMVISVLVLELVAGGDAQAAWGALGIAAALLKSEESDKAGAMLKKASTYDKIRSQSLLYLGDLAFRQGQGQLAVASYREVAERAPAWMLPLERLALCYRALEDDAALTALEAEIARRRSVMDRLLGGG